MRFRQRLDLTVGKAELVEHAQIVAAAHGKALPVRAHRHGAGLAAVAGLAALPDVHGAAPAQKLQPLGLAPHKQHPQVLRVACGAHGEAAVGADGNAVHRPADADHAEVIHMPLVHQRHEAVLGAHQGPAVRQDEN